MTDQYQISLSDAAYAVLCGLVAPAAEVDHTQIGARSAVWDELRHELPYESFTLAVRDGIISYWNDQAHETASMQLHTHECSNDTLDEAERAIRERQDALEQPSQHDRLADTFRDYMDSDEVRVNGWSVDDLANLAEQTYAADSG